MTHPVSAACLNQTCPLCLARVRKLMMISAEQWLAEEGYADSRPHSNVEIARLLEKYLAACRLEEAKQLIAEGKIANLAYHKQGNADATVHVKAFDNARAVGLMVQWSEKGTGFGEITIALDRDTVQFRGDTEGMGPDFCARMFALVAERFAG